MLPFLGELWLQTRPKFQNALKKTLVCCKINIAATTYFVIILISLILSSFLVITPVKLNQKSKKASQLNAINQNLIKTLSLFDMV